MLVFLELRIGFRALSALRSEAGLRGFQLVVFGLSGLGQNLPKP